MTKQRCLEPDNKSAFLDALCTRAMNKIHEAAAECGIILKYLCVRWCLSMGFEPKSDYSTAVVCIQPNPTTTNMQVHVEAAVGVLVL